MTATATRPARSESWRESLKANAPARLGKAVAWADQNWMKPFRTRRVAAIKSFANVYGSQSGGTDKDGGSDRPQPINTHYGLIQTLLPALSSEAGIDVAAVERFNNWQAAALEFRINRVFDQIRFRDTLDDLILHAFFGAAVLYTNLSASEYRPESDVQGTDGVFCEVVDLDDYICDPFAAREYGMSFQAHKMRFGFEWAMDQKDMFNRSLLEKVGRLQMDAHRKARADMIAKQGSAAYDRWIDTVELYSVYLPGHIAGNDGSRVVGIPGQADQTEGFIFESEWKGPAEGPYDPLNFMRVPGNSMPTTVIQQGDELHQTINMIARKITQQAERQKDVTVGPADDKEGNAAMVGASDGDHVMVIGDPKAYQRVSTGGPNQVNIAAMEFFSKWLNWLSGNPDSIGGLSRQSDTATQDQMLFNNAGNKLLFWRNRVLDVGRRVGEKVAFFELNDPVTTHSIQHPAMNGQPPMMSEWGPEDRAQVTMTDLTITARQYGIASDTPERQFQRLSNLTQGILLPLQGALVQQGKTLNIPVIVEALIERANVPNSQEFIIDLPQQVNNENAQALGGMKPAGGGNFFESSAGNGNVSGGRPTGSRTGSQMPDVQKLAQMDQAGQAEAVEAR